MNESAVKRTIVKSMFENNGYARRLEDQYAVGIFDMILIPKGLPVFMAEVKVIKDNVFGPTPRQQIELMRIEDVASDKGHVIPVMIGWRDGVFYFHKPLSKIDRRECFSVTTSEVPFYKQLTLYYYSIRGKVHERTT
jgi:ribosomal protein S4E